jgi:hypothetical protein
MDEHNYAMEAAEMVVLKTGASIAFVVPVV